MTLKSYVSEVRMLVSYANGYARCRTPVADGRAPLQRLRQRDTASS